MNNTVYAGDFKPEIKFSCVVPRMVDLIEAHDVTGLSISRLRYGYRSGEFVGIRCGTSSNGKILLNLDKLIEYLNTHTETVEPAPEYSDGHIHPVNL